jgi:hypothetical protein
LFVDRPEAQNSVQDFIDWGVIRAGDRAMTTQQLPKLLCIFSMVLVVLGTGAVFGLPLVAEHAAPFHETTSVCLVCGRMQTVGQGWMQPPTESFSGLADFEWMRAKIDRKHDHWWIGCSTHARPNWLARSYFGCGGGIGGVSQFHQLALTSGEDVAEPFIREYRNF